MFRHPAPSSRKPSVFPSAVSFSPDVLRLEALKVGAWTIGIGFGGILYYNYNKEPLKPYSNH